MKLAVEDSFAARQFYEMTGSPCVYLLLSHREVVYVGKTICITSRIACHKRDREKDFDQVFYFESTPEDVGVLEMELIRKYQPKFNYDGLSFEYVANKAKDFNAIALGSIGGKIGGKNGGKNRAMKLSKERRSEIARSGAMARWGRRDL